MEPSIFAKIIQGEIPAHKVYEDERTLAFLDIYPTVPGHVLVIPKAQVDRMEDLDETDYRALTDTVHKVMRRVVEVYGPEYRACLKVIGFDVPHAHVHVMPCRSGQEFHRVNPGTDEPDHQALTAEAQKIAF